MEKYTEKQYDDDLTVVADEYNESFQTDNVDLFEFPSYDESPIARLKSLVLSIDWEITDDILRQFNEELIDLKDIWADEKIYLVYVQALEKISKYIYQEKADSNPNAIKLLLTFYYNLEKIISSEDMPEEEKKQILLEDVRKFEKLKQQIGKAAKTERNTPAVERAEDTVSAFDVFSSPEVKNILFNLKAIVLGIDWEITEKDLGKLRDEVIRLEEVFTGSRPKLIFLQGIGTLGAYIRLKKSNSHADAFKLLHSFFAGLEKIVATPLSLEEEKATLFPEVEKFNAFKAIIGSTISPEVTQGETDEDFIEYDDEDGEEGRIAPAFSDLPEGEARGFQEEEEAAALGFTSTFNVANQVDMFFSEELDLDQLHVDVVKTPSPVEREPRDEFRDAAEAQLDAIFQTDFSDGENPGAPHVDQAMALRGVDVETEADDDSDEDELPLEAGQLAPALAEIGEESRRDIQAFGIIEEQKSLAGDLENSLDDFFADEKGPVEEQTPYLSLSEDELEDFEKAPAEVIAAASLAGKLEALQGVNVETEDEEDSVEEALAYANGDLAPALSDEEPIAGSGWQTETALKDADELSFTLDEPIPALSGNLQDENRLAELPGADAESEVALEDHLDSFFALEEVEEEISVEDRDEVFDHGMPASELFAEPAGEIETEGLRLTEVQEEEQHQMVAGLEQALASHAEDQPASSLFEQEVLRAEIIAETEIVSFLATTIEPEQEEVVFELVEEDEDVFSSFGEEENLFAGETRDEEIVEETKDLTLSLEPESSSALQEDPPVVKTGEGDQLAVPAQEADSSTIQFVDSAQDTTEIGAEGDEAGAFLAEASFQEENEVEALAIFEEVDEEVAEDALPHSQLLDAGQLQADPVDLGPEDTLDAELLSVIADESEPPYDEGASFEEEFILPSVEDPLSNLYACVSSIGLALDDSIVQGLYKEIDALRSRAISQPLDKLFLLLLSTITQHIDQYRYESSSEAFSLLQSVMKSFADSLEAVNDLAAQEVLLVETTKVLLWQQRMLNRQAVAKGDQLTFADPVRFEPGESLDDEEISFIEDETENEFAAVFVDVADEDLGPEDEITFAKEQDPHPASAERKPDDEETAVDDLFFSDLEAELATERTEIVNDTPESAPFDQQFRSLIQGEFALIRQEWQNDLAALRNELKGNEEQNMV